MGFIDSPLDETVFPNDKSFQEVMQQQRGINSDWLTIPYKLIRMKSQTRLPTLEKRVIESKALLKALVGAPATTSQNSAFSVKAGDDRNQLAKTTDFPSLKAKEVEQLANDEHLLGLVVQFEKQCAKYRVDSFYSYYLMSHLKYLTKEKGELLLMREIDLVSRGKSIFHRVQELVNSRERFLGILRQQIESYADDSVFEHVQQLAGETTNPEPRQKKVENILASIRGLRLLNIELIEEVQKWKAGYQDIRKQATIPVNWENIAYMYRNQNYLIKMTSDASFVSACQIQGLIFSTGNDPFILRPLKSPVPDLVEKLQVDEALHPRVVECLEVLAREKSDEFRCKLEGANIIDRGDKMGQIKHIYQAKDPKKPKLNLESMEKERTGNSFDEDDEFDSLVRRYEKEILLGIKNKNKAPQKKASSLQVEAISGKSPKQSSSQRLKLLREDVNKLAQIRKESLEVKERIAEGMKTIREKPMIKLVEEKEPQPAEAQPPIQQRSMSQSKLKKEVKAMRASKVVEKQKQEKSLEKSNIQPPDEERKVRQSSSNLDIWRSYSTVVDTRKRSVDHHIKLERQSKLIEELKERLKEAELQKDKFTKYQNYVAQRRSKNQKSEIPEESIPEETQKTLPMEVAQPKRDSLSMLSPYRKLTPKVVNRPSSRTSRPKEEILKSKEPKQPQEQKSPKPKEQSASKPKTKQPEPQRTEQAEQVEKALKKLKNKLKGKSVQPEATSTAITESNLIAAEIIPKKRESIVIPVTTAPTPATDLEEKKKANRERYDDIKKIYSNKQNVKLKDETIARPSELDMNVLKKKIEDEMRQKLLAEMRAARQVEESKKIAELEALRQKVRQVDKEKHKKHLSEESIRINQHEEEMMRNIQLQKEMVEEQEQLRKRVQQEANIRQLRLREQYEEQLRNVAEQYKKQALEIQYRLEKQEQEAKQKQRRLQLEEQEKQRLEEELHKKQLRQELLKEIEMEASKKAQEQETEYFKQEMEKEMLRLRSKEEQMVLELQQENLLRLEQLKRLRAEQQKVNSAVQEQLRKLQQERKERELEKEKQRLNNSTSLVIEADELTRSIPEESKLDGSMIQPYSPERQEKLKQQLKKEILLEFQDRQSKRREEEQQLEEQRRLKYQLLEDEYRKIFEQKHKQFEEQLAANMQREDLIRQQIVQQREESIKANQSFEKKLPNIAEERLHTVEGKSRQLLKQVQSDEEQQELLEEVHNAEPEGTKPNNESWNESYIKPIEESSRVKIDEPATKPVQVNPADSLLRELNKSEVNIQPETIQDQPAKPPTVIQEEKPRKTEPTPKQTFEIIEDKSEPSQLEAPSKSPESPTKKPEKDTELAESVFVESPSKPHDKELESLPSFPRNPASIVNNSSTLVETQEDILKKWNHLRPHLRPSKKKYIEAHSVKEFITAFLEKQNRQGMTPQMLPYSQKQLNYILRKKQVDIFPNSMGWREGDKYILLGNLQCLGELSDLYGNIQVEIRMNMDSSNPKEKRYFANRLRFFETVGYVYQKRLQGDFFAIKVIIKIPRGLKVQRPRNNNRLNLECAVQMDGKSTFEKTRNDCSYIFTLANKLIDSLTEDEKLVLAKYGESNYISKELFGLMSAIDVHKHRSQGVSLKQSKTQSIMQLNLEIPVCLSTYPCLRFESNQIFTNQGATFYTSNSACPGFAVVVIPLESPKLEFDLDTYLKIMKKEGKSKETQLWLPMWKTQRRVRVDSFGTKPFTFRTDCNPTFDIGSIFEQPKGNCITVKPPFIFAVLSETLEQLCECSPIYSEVVRPENLLTSPATD